MSLGELQLKPMSRGKLETPFKMLLGSVTGEIGVRGESGVRGEIGASSSIGGSEEKGVLDGVR